MATWRIFKVIGLHEKDGISIAKEKHLHRYLSEFDFRYGNRVALGVNDVARAEIALKSVKGKRLKSQRLISGTASYGEKSRRVKKEKGSLAN